MPITKNTSKRESVKLRRLLFRKDKKIEKKVKLTEVKEQYKNAQVSYENDLLTREEERSARTLLYTAELNFLYSLYDFEMSLITLELLSGMEF